RPLLVLLACDLFDGKISKAIPAALAIELFHNFTLVHDDIIDNAPLRRNKPTVYSKWNTNIAILSGDVMLVVSCRLISKAKLSKKIYAQVSETFLSTATLVCEGQQWDLNYERSETISVEQYYKMIELKTAVLLAASMKIGALIGGAKGEDAEKLYEFGRNSGIAFQLQDDLLDVYGNAEKFGKQSGGDIIANKKTFLLIKAMELSAGNPQKKKELAHWLSFIPKNEKEEKEKISGVKNIYDAVGVKKLAESEIQLFYKKAFDSLSQISASPEKKKTLNDFISSMLKRES
ncbi:MAG TPA: polyprenyl synthetase family protein, partial [Bacteroidia bacterium]